MDLDDDVSSTSSSVESTSSKPNSAPPAREYLLHKAKFTTTGRVVEGVKSPPMHPLAHEKLFDPETGKPNVLKLKKWFRKEGRLNKDDILTIVSEASAILRKEPNLLSVSSPITGTLELLACRSNLEIRQPFGDSVALLYLDSSSLSVGACSFSLYPSILGLQQGLDAQFSP